MKDQNSETEKINNQEVTQVFLHDSVQQETDKSKSREADGKPISSGIGKPAAGAAIVGAGLAGIAAGTVYSEEIKNEVKHAKSELDGLVNSSGQDETPISAPIEPDQIVSTKEDSFTSPIPEVKPVPVSLASHTEASTSAPTEMGISHNFEDGRVFQISFTDVDHDGKIDSWTASATDVAGNSEMVTGTGEQLTAIFIGEPSYAQQVDYVDEQTPVSSMAETFEPIDWQSVADEPVETMETVEAELVIEAEFEAGSDNPEISIESYITTDSPEFIGPIYEEQVNDMPFEQMEVPDSFPMDDFVTAQFL
jgi:hypothetical protein